MMETSTGRETRPSPDALLREHARGVKGRLKIFLGAAPGVGKTYEMLQTAQARLRDGVDVLIGVVETHGRRETQRLVEGLEVVPRRSGVYKGHAFEEMDLDSILERKPALVLVDELAHTNAPGSRHPKRYLDVQEILESGIDVFTTVNIQHIESLNDVVAKITRVRVRETVPDSLIDEADDVTVVDLTPDDLIRRLREGKVYVPLLAERAIQNYFAPGNLTALRELALRRTAQRVDAQMVTYMQAHAIAGPWSTSERVLVAINDNANPGAVVRYARRIADRMRAPWGVLYVESPRSHRPSEAERDGISDALRLAQRLGGDARTVPGASVADDIVEYARAHNYTHIVVARAPVLSWRKWIETPLAHRLIDKAGDISVHVIAEYAEEASEKSASQAAAQTSAAVFDGKSYGAAFALVGVALAVGVCLSRFLAVSNIALVFLTAVLASAIARGLGPALAAAAASVLAYNFFFLPPLYTFTIADPENVVNLVFFAAVAFVASNLAARVRNQAMAASQRAKTTEDLYGFSRKLAGAVTLDDLLWASAFQMASMLKVNVVLLLPAPDALEVKVGYPPEDTLDESDLAAAKWCWRSKKPAGRGADTLPGAKRLFIPMQTGRGAVGVIGLDSERPGPLLTPDQRRLLDALGDQAALAIEHVGLAQAMDEARLDAETDRLRSALLTSISHDLRTPLASILGSASSLRSYRATLDDRAQEELIATIQEESERLNRFIANLLDMTRLESGAIMPRMDLIDLSDVVASTVRRAERVLAGRELRVEMAPQLVMVRVDPVLLEQALFNLVDNAGKYSPPTSVIIVKTEVSEKLAHIRVLDEGQGVPAESLELIFDKFYRVLGTDRQRAGTGLGLAIARGFVESMEGAVYADNRADRAGAVFTIELPLARSRAPLDDAPLDDAPADDGPLDNER